MTHTAVLLFVFMILAGVGGMFLYGWRRRNEKMPAVPPLPPEEDDWK